MVQLSTVRYSSKMCCIHITRSCTQKLGSYIKCIFNIIIIIRLVRLARIAEDGRVILLVCSCIVVARKATMLRKCCRLMQETQGQV